MRRRISRCCNWPARPCKTRPRTQARVLDFEESSSMRYTSASFPVGLAPFLADLRLPRLGRGRRNRISTLHPAGGAGASSFTRAPAAFSSTSGSVGDCWIANDTRAAREIGSGRPSCSSGDRVPCWASGASSLGPAAKSPSRNPPRRAIGCCTS